MELEKIKKILAKVPDGATHCTDTVPSMNLYAKVVHLGGFYVSLGNKWEAYPIYAGIHLLSDLQAIIDAKERIAELEHYNLGLAQESHQRQQRIDELEQWIAAIADDHPQIPGWIQQSARSLLAKGADMALEYAPAQCLAEIKAQAGRDAVVSALRLYGEPTMAVSEIDSLADRYANQLRQQAKAGE